MTREREKEAEVRIFSPCRNCLRYDRCYLDVKDSPALDHCDLRIDLKCKPKRIKPAGKQK
jgi:hypothetical protein